MSNTQVIDQLFKKQPTNNTSTDHTEIICIIDRSGSMQSVAVEASGGLNAFVEKQKEGPGTASITIVEFDDQIETVCQQININEAQKYGLVPRGMTALYDAVGTTITSFPKTSDKKIVIIITDGYDNTSREYSKSSVAKLITTLKEQEWDFIFLAADIDASAVGGSLGIDPDAAIKFTKSGKDVEDMYGTVAQYACSVRSCASKGDSRELLKGIK